MGERKHHIKLETSIKLIDTPPVTFYILHTRFWQEKDLLACQLANKAWHQGYQIYIHTDSIAAARRLDVMLWTFKEESFLPHDIYPDVESKAPIRIGYTEQFGENMDVLINLTQIVPSFFEQFKRIAEIVDDKPLARDAGRKRYRFYRERGAVLENHEINRLGTKT